MGTNRLIPIGVASCYPASLVKNLIRWCQIFEVLQLQPQNVQSNQIYVSVGIVGFSHVWSRQWTITPSLQDVEFLDHNTRRPISPFHVAQCWNDKHFLL